jgi:hypothetical protein
MRKTSLLLIAALTIIALSCSKDDAATKKEMLTGKNWILTAETINPGLDFGGGIIITDIYSQYDQCYKDNIANFTTSGNYTFEEGPTKCDSNDPQVFDAGTWTFNSDETILVVTSTTDGVMNLTIQELTASKLVVTFEQTYDAIKYKMTSTYQVK